MKKESFNPMEVPLIMDLLDRSLDGYFFALAFHVDPNATQYAIGNLLPYECNFGRTVVFSPDEYAMTVHCRVKGIRSGELVMQVLRRMLLVAQPSISSMTVIQKLSAMTSRASPRLLLF